VAHAFDLDVAGAGDELGDAPPAARVDQRVAAAVQDQRGHGHVPQGLGARAVGDGGRHLPAAALGAEAAVVGGRGAGPDLVLVDPLGLRPVDGEALQVAVDVLLARPGRPGQQQAQRDRRGLAAVGLAGARHDRRHRQQPVGVVDGEALDDHPAQRQAHHVRPGHLERVEHGQGVGGHVGQRVLDAVELGRQPGVTVVEPRHLVAVGGELPAPLLGVVGALRPQPVDQQQGRIARVAEGLVVDRDLTVDRDRHGALPLPNGSRQRR
jgi:hypothetical protein